MGSLRRAIVWIVYVPLTVFVTWLLVRLGFVLSELLTLGHADPNATAERLVRMSLPYAGLGALVAYAASAVFLRLRKVTPFVVFAELGSIGAAKTFGLLAVIIHARGYDVRYWIGLAVLGLAWLAIERRGAWPWRRAFRMCAFAAGVFLVVQNAVGL